MSRKPVCIDVYCGAGGTSYGAQAAGLHVAYGLDRDHNAVRTFVRNHPNAYGDCRDVAQVKAREILDLADVDRVDYLLSGPNCQAVSTMGLFYSRDPRNLLFVHLARLIDELRSLGAAPQNVLIENVPGIAFKRNVRIVKDLIQFFRERDYRCAADVVNFAAWGVPQLRYRFVLIATRADVQPSLPPSVASVETGEGLVTTLDAIGDLYGVKETPPEGVAARVVPRRALTAYQRTMAGTTAEIHNHHVGRTAPIDLQRISHVPRGGSWKDIPPHLMPERFRRVRMTDYKTLYGRLTEDHPAYTISASFANVTSGCFTHPRHHRPLTVREGCRLQGFPDEFVVTGPVPSQYRQIGNAVPAFAAKVLLEHWQALISGRSVKSVPLRLTEDLLSTAGGLKLPVLTPRYHRIGYGSGTYWPKGWGRQPEARPTSETDYRISTDPIRYRRISWRLSRDERLAESLKGVRNLDWSPLIRAVRKKRPTVLVFDGLAICADGKVSSELARTQFMEFIAPAGSALGSALSSSHILVRCDFDFTADWLQRFTALLLRAENRPIGCVDVDGRKHRWASGRRAVWFSSGSWRKDLDLRRLGLVVLIAPFADIFQSLGLGKAPTLELPSASDALRIRGAKIELAVRLGRLGFSS